MGRPLNKKYFGNRNFGTGSYEGTSLGNSVNYEDDKIGGEGIASINWSNRGSWLATAGGAAAPLAGLQLPAPTLPGGVQATWTNYFGAAAVTTGAGKAGLILNETYEFASIPGLVVQVTNLSGANAIFTVLSEGSTTTLLTDTQGVNLTLRTGQGHTGAGTFQVDIFMKVVNTVINERGSGYTGAETFTVTLANSATGTVPVGTDVLTTSQENAIVIRANVTDDGAKVGDIIKQVSTNRYKVKTADGTGIVELVVQDSTPNVGKAMIIATDSDGSTYYVQKLTARKAVVYQKTTSGSYQFVDGQAVQWTFGSPVEDYSVTIENA